MSADALQTLCDQQAIREALWRYCRTLDRMDREGARALWCEDAQAVYHGMYEGSGHGFVDWVWEQHQRMRAHFHQLSNLRIEVDGDQACSEAYVTVTLWPREPESPATLIQAFGRYLDQWRREQGVWKISRREMVTDLQSTHVPQTVETSAVSHRGREDPSFRFLSA